MSRRNDRRHAFELTFQIEFHNENELEESVNLYFENIVDAEKYDRNFIEGEFRGVLKNKVQIDELINNASEGWSVDRLSKSDLAIIRLCVYEMMFNEEIPKNVAINEAVELAKVFSADEAPAFVNGVLAKIVKNL